MKYEVSIVTTEYWNRNLEVEASSPDEAARLVYDNWLDYWTREDKDYRYDFEDTITVADIYQPDGELVGGDA